jgi:hypothetical protein
MILAFPPAAERLGFPALPVLQTDVALEDRAGRTSSPWACTSGDLYETAGEL